MARVQASNFFWGLLLLATRGQNRPTHHLHAWALASFYSPTFFFSMLFLLSHYPWPQFPKCELSLHLCTCSHHSHNQIFPLSFSLCTYSSYRQPLHSQVRLWISNSAWLDRIYKQLVLTFCLMSHTNQFSSLAGSYTDTSRWVCYRTFYSGLHICNTLSCCTSHYDYSFIFT